MPQAEGLLAGGLTGRISPFLPDDIETVAECVSGKY
jgi:hypothetical protein